jgi:multidrug efflux pump subunit AcrB
MAAVMVPVARGYESILSSLIVRPWRVLVPALVLGAAGYSLFPMVGVSFFPSSEKPEFLINVEGPEDWSLAQTDSVVREIEAWLDEDSEVTAHFVNVGRGNPRIYYNVAPERERANVAQIVVRASDRDRFGTLLPRLREKVALIPDAEILVEPFVNGPPVEAPVAVKIVGPDLERIVRLAGEVDALLRTVEGARDIRAPMLKPRSDLLISINREKAGLLGVPVAAIDQAVRAALEGVPVGRFRDEDGEAYAISVELDRQGMPEPDDLDRIRVASRAGDAIPLRQLADVVFEPVLNRIDHYATIRSTTVTAEVRDGYLSADVIGEVRDLLSGLDVPVGFRVFMAGEAEELGDSFTDLLRALLLANLGIFAVLVLQFRSLAQPMIILLALPLAIPGSIVALLLAGYTFSFFAFVGLTALAGVVINNAIILIDTANRKRDDGLPPDQAMVSAAGIRLYPILLTTMTTIAGLLPLTLQNSDLWSPLGWTIIGGMVCSTVLSLFVVPALYGLLERRTSRSID